MSSYWKKLCEVKYTAGEDLHYSTLGVIRVIFWLLWGGFWFSLLEYVLVPTLLPLSFKQLGASGALMGIMLGSVPAAINFILNPILSTMSDRTRTRIGRRIPYLLYSIPFVLISSVALGWIPELSGLIHRILPGVELKTVSLVLLCSLTIVFYVTGLFGGAIGCYLPPDVLPFSFIGSFQAASSVVCSAASFAFNYWLMPYVGAYSRWLFTGIGIAFTVCYLVMCIMVKEGSYPPPEALKRKTGSLYERLSEWFLGYFKECFSRKIILYLFLGVAITQVSTRCRSIFNIIFATHDLALTTAQYGYISAIGSLVSLSVSLTGIFWIDRVNPILVYMGSGLPILALNVWGYFGVHDYNSFFIVGILITIAYCIQNLGWGPMLMLIFPRDKYGQYSSAQAMTCCIFSVIGSYGCGIAVDLFGNRFIYGWDFVFTVIATLILLKVYFDWKKYVKQTEAGTKQS